MNTKELQEQLSTAAAEELKGNYTETEGLAQQVLRELDAETPPSEQSAVAAVVLVLRAEATKLLGVVEWRRGNNTKALEYYLAALSLAESSGDKVTQARVVNNIGTVHQSFSDYPKALEYFVRALSQYEEVGDKVGVASATGNIGLVYKSLSDYSRALHYLMQALSMHVEVGNRDSIASVTCNIGNVYILLSDYSRALEYYSRALLQFEEVGNKAYTANVTGNIGGVYISLSDYPKALEYFARALALHEEVGNKASMATVTCNIGIVHKSLANYAKALEYYERALTLAEEVGDKNTAANVMGSIGLVHYSRSDYSKALEYYARALSLYEEVGDRAGLARVNGNIGSVHRILSDNPRAVQYYSYAVKTLDELGHKSDAAYFRASLGALYASVVNPDRDVSKAEWYLLESIAASDELGTKKYEAHKSLAELYERQKRWQESLIQFKKYHDVQQEVQSEEAKKSATLLEQRKQIAEREKEIELAKAAATAKLNATTTLLHKVLPETIATRMIEGEQDIADYFPQVSILFADIAGFTPLSADMPASVVVRFLNHVFREFDRIMKKHGCEKIKTIGDGYMAVAGAPVECADHAERIAAAALEMQETISLPADIREHLPTGASFGVRIGLHTGSVVAGVIGDERFVYDVYSDAVNTASRMESHGEASRIHVSQDFYRHMQNRFSASKKTTHGLTFEKRGEMEIKGKGMMRTYYVEKA